MITKWASMLSSFFICKAFICYILGFCIFHNVAGGYHADTHLKCYLLSIVMVGIAYSPWKGAINTTTL